MIIISSVPHECLHGFLSQTSLSACFQWQLPYYVPLPELSSHPYGHAIRWHNNCRFCGYANGGAGSLPGKRVQSARSLSPHLPATTFQAVRHTRNQQPYRHLHDKETDYHRSNRIEHAPMISQQDGTADTDGRPDRRQCITPVMPGIGYHSLGVQLLALNHCILIKYLL